MNQSFTHTRGSVFVFVLLVITVVIAFVTFLTSTFQGSFTEFSDLSRENQKSNALLSEVLATIELYKNDRKSSDAFLSDSFEKTVTAFSLEIRGELSGINDEKIYVFNKEQEEFFLPAIQNYLYDLSKLQLAWNWKVGASKNQFSVAENANIEVVYKRKNRVTLTETGATVLFTNGYTSTGATSVDFTSVTVLDATTLPLLFSNLDFNNFDYTFTIKMPQDKVSHFQLSGIKADGVTPAKIPSPILKYNIIPQGKISGKEGSVSLYSP